MEAKDKAYNLYLQYRTTNFSTWTNRHDAIKMSLIAVDEILNTESLKNRICGYTKLNTSHIEYWEEVKNEIEKM